MKEHVVSAEITLPISVGDWLRSLLGTEKGGLGYLEHLAIGRVWQFDRVSFSTEPSSPPASSNCGIAGRIGGSESANLSCRRLTDISREGSTQRVSWEAPSR